jgi:hypothetical protein
MKSWQKTVHCSAIVAITWLLSVAVLISAAQFDVAQAKKGRAAALACGKQLQKQCGGVPVLANNMQECLKKIQGKLSPRCVAHANNVVRSCERDSLQHCQAVVGGYSGYGGHMQSGPSNILGCLIAGQRVVSPQCHAALDVVFPR